MVDEDDFSEALNIDQQGGVFIARTSDIEVCLLALVVDSPNLGKREVNQFVYYVPDKHNPGRFLATYNPLIEGGFRTAKFEDTNKLRRAFETTIRHGLKRNPGMIMLYKGKKLRDMAYVIRRFE